MIKHTRYRPYIRRYRPEDAEAMPASLTIAPTSFELGEDHGEHYREDMAFSPDCGLKVCHCGREYYGAGFRVQCRLCRDGFRRWIEGLTEHQRAAAEENFRAVFARVVG